MAAGTVVGQPWIEDGRVCLAVKVASDALLNGTPVAVEYVGRVPLPEIEALATNAEKKAALIAAVKAARDAQKSPPPTAPSISGSVTI